MDAFALGKQMGRRLTEMAFASHADNCPTPDTCCMARIGLGAPVRDMKISVVCRRCDHTVTDHLTNGCARCDCDLTRSALLELDH